MKTYKDVFENKYTPHLSGFNFNWIIVKTPDIKPEFAENLQKSDLNIENSPDSETEQTTTLPVINDVDYQIKDVKRGLFRRK